MAVRDASVVPQLEVAVFSRYSVLFAGSVLLWMASGGSLVARVLAVVVQLVIYVRAYAGIWVVLEAAEVDDAGSLCEPYWLSTAVAVTIGASTVSLHVLRLRWPMLLAVVLVALVGVLEAAFGIHEYGTARDVVRLRAMLEAEKERGEQ